MSDRLNYNPEHCAALDCTIVVGRNVLMCRKHAAMVPTGIGDALRDFSHKETWSNPIKLHLIEAAVQAVAAKEGKIIHPIPEFHDGRKK